MNITINTKVLQENHLSLGDFLMLLIGFYGIDYKKCLENLVGNGIISPNVWGDNSVVMSNNTKDMIANILVNSDEKVVNSPIDFKSLALKMQECYPEGCKPGTSYEWRGKTEEIALKLKTLIAIHDFSFTEEEALKAVKNPSHHRMKAIIVR